MDALRLWPQVSIPVPSPAEWLMIIAAPFLALLVLRGLGRGAKAFVRRFFPLWEWEKELGWLNIRAHKRAEAVMRWLGHLFKALLALALYGIVWAAPALSSFDQWKDPNDVAENMARLTVLIWCSALWTGYFCFELIPKLRAEHEWEELKRFRAEQKEREDEMERKYPSRGVGAKVKWPLRSSRVGGRQD